MSTSGTTRPVARPARRRTIGPWRLEWLRLTRSPRGLILLAGYLLFGVIAPLEARYLTLLPRPAAPGSRAVDLDLQPAGSFANYLGRVNQFGLFLVIAVAAGALCLDSRPALSVFHRTRAPSAFAIIWPRYLASALAASCALAAGAAVAWYETSLMLGRLPVDRVLLGVAGEVVFLAFAVAVVALAGGYARSVPATVGIGVVVLLVVLPVLGAIEPIRAWSPIALLRMPVKLIAGTPDRPPPEITSVLMDAARGGTVTVVTTVGLLALAVRRFARREI